MTKKILVISLILILSTSNFVYSMEKSETTSSEKQKAHEYPFLQSRSYGNSLITIIHVSKENKNFSEKETKETEKNNVNSIETEENDENYTDLLLEIAGKSPESPETPESKKSPIKIIAYNFLPDGSKKSIWENQDLQTDNDHFGEIPELSFTEMFGSSEDLLALGLGIEEMLETIKE